LQGAVPGPFCLALGLCADFVPAIADGIFEAFPGTGVACFLVAAGIGFQSGPVAPTVAFICAQLIAVAVGGLILRIGSAPAGKRCGVVLPEDGVVGSKVLGVGFLKGTSAIRSHREFLGRERNFTGLHCWARGYGVSTLGLDEQVIREDIRNQENEEKRQAQMQLKGLETLSYATEGSSGPFIGVREGLEALSDHSWPPPGAFSKLPALRVVLDFLCKRLKMLLLYPGTLVFCACDTTTCTTGYRHWCH
jgi:hypothetical protein